MQQLFLREEPIELKNLSDDQESNQWYNVEISERSGNFFDKVNEKGMRADAKIQMTNAKYLVIRSAQKALGNAWIDISSWKLYQPLKASSERSSLYLKKTHIKEVLEIAFVNLSERDQFSFLLSRQCLICNSINDDFEFLEKIGGGNQAQVNLYRIKREVEGMPSVFAVKTYLNSSNKRQQQSYLNEIRFLKLFQENDNIVKLQRVYQENDKVHLVMDYAGNGTLSDYIHNGHKITESNIKAIMFQLLKGLQSLQQKNIIHLDLKPSNILIKDIDSFNVWISDFGISHEFNSNLMTKIQRGTPGYIAPEVIQSAAPCFKSDIFSLGCVLYFLLTRQSLFQGDNLSHLILQNQHKEPTYMIIKSNLDSKFSSKCTDLLRKMLIRNHSQRMNVNECLQHSWFRTLRGSLIPTSDQLIPQSFQQSDFLQKFLNTSQNKDSLKIPMLSSFKQNNLSIIHDEGNSSLHVKQQQQPERKIPRRRTSKQALDLFLSINKVMPYSQQGQEEPPLDKSELSLVEADNDSNNKFLLPSGNFRIANKQSPANSKNRKECISQNRVPLDNNPRLLPLIRKKLMKSINIIEDASIENWRHLSLNLAQINQPQEQEIKDEEDVDEYDMNEGQVFAHFEGRRDINDYQIDFSKMNIRVEAYYNQKENQQQNS